MVAALVAALAAPGFAYGGDRNHGHRTSVEGETDSFSCAEGAVVGDRCIGRPDTRRAALTVPAGDNLVYAKRKDPLRPGRRGGAARIRALLQRTGAGTEALEFPLGDRMESPRG